MEVTSETIENDITKLKNSLRMCVKSIRKYKEVIEEKRVEQEDLRRLVEQPGEYNVEALKRNVDDCDKHIMAFENTINGERRAMNRYNNIIEVLEKKKWQLEMTS